MFISKNKIFFAHFISTQIFFLTKQYFQFFFSILEHSNMYSFVGQRIFNWYMIFLQVFPNILSVTIAKALISWGLHWKATYIYMYVSTVFSVVLGLRSPTIVSLSKLCILIMHLVISSILISEVSWKRYWQFCFMISQNTLSFLLHICHFHIGNCSANYIIHRLYICIVERFLKNWSISI